MVQPASAIYNLPMRDSFDLPALAAYLHLTPDKVRRMADRGQVPGRKVGGQWQFSEADIHHWLEARIGASDDAELQAVESVLERATPSEQAPLLASLVPPGGVAAQLLARTRHSAIEKMCELAADTGLLWDPDKMQQAVRARESLHPTALDNGAALLHPRRPLPSILAEGFVAVGRTGQGIPFGGGNLTDVFFLICSTNDAEHLRILARLSRLLAIEAVLPAIRDAEDEADIRAVFQQWGEQLESRG